MTVSNCSQPRDLQRMALLDEYADFNHWALLVREGEIGTITSDVPLYMFRKASIIAIFDAGMDAFDMDVDVCDLKANALSANDTLTQ